MEGHYTFFSWVCGEYYETETRVMTHDDAFSFAESWGLEFLAW